MNSRQRIQAAFEHKETGWIPVDLSGHRSSGISAVLYPRLRSALDLPPSVPKVYDIIQQLAVVEDDVLSIFGSDTIELGRAFAQDESSWVDWTLPDGTRCLVPAWTPPKKEGKTWVLQSRTGRVLGRMPEGALYFEQDFYPFLGGDEVFDRLELALTESMWTAVAAPPGPVSDEELKEGARRLRASTDKAILGLFGGNLLEIGQFLFRNDHFFMLLASEPQRAHQFLDRLTEIHLANLIHYLSLVGDFIDVIVFGDDLGMQTGPQISPQMYREFFKPRHQLLWQRAKEEAQVKVMLHCCGGVRELLPDLIDAGLDAINPVQTSCRGMAPEELKASFGRDLTFWGGGCDSTTILPNSTPQEVKEHVRARIETWKPGGGFVFQQVHNILSDVPPENVIAMFEAVRECQGD